LTKLSDEELEYREKNYQSLLKFIGMEIRERREQGKSTLERYEELILKKRGSK
jgi:hypothetical protein